MSSAKHFTEVLIGGKVYTLSGFEGEEYLQKVSSYLNYKITEVRTVKDTENRVQTQGMSFLHLILQMIILKQRNREIPWKAISSSKIKRCMI